MVDLRGLILSAVEIKALTGWPDQIVEEFLTITTNFVELGLSIQNSAAEIEQNAAAIVSNSNAIGANTSLIEDNTSSINEANADISNNAAAISTNASGIAINSMDISALEVATEWLPVAISADFDAASRQVILCQNTVVAVVTLTILPADKDELYIKSTGAGSVDVDGNGKLIDGAATQTLVNQYDVLHLMYTQISGEWNIL